MRIISTFIIITLFSLCSTNLFAGESKVKNIKPDIVGKTFFFDYGSYAYDITVASEKVLYWKLVKGKFEGPDKGKNSYLSSQIEEGIIFLSWIEESGMEFYNLMNLKTGKLTTHANANGMSINMGSVSIKKINPKK